MSVLFSSLQIRDVALKNRIAISPMCQYSAQDGFANDWHFVHLGSRATGGAGLVITEAAAVSAEGRISPYDLGLWKDEHVEPLHRIVNFIHQQGCVAAVQLAHAGHKASSQTPFEGGRYIAPADGGWQPISASSYQLVANDAQSKDISTSEIEQIIADFKSATHRALAAGFKVIEIHAAHGYLLNGFLSPLVNRRTDDYGGSFANRTRLLIAIVQETRKIIPNGMPLFVRLSATDWTAGGWTIEDSVALSRILKNEGVDLIDCSSGGLTAPSNIPVAPNYQVPFAEKIKQEVGIQTGAVGLITTPKQAEGIIENNQADLVLIARESLRDPQFPLRAAHELGATVKWPVQYERGRWR
jgi:2,4-dienoyl-CoA reductase-like NADH-dependent reductase (Old Yellow Enzyme family)